jgi:hypothetical protein
MVQALKRDMIRYVWLVSVGVVSFRLSPAFVVPALRAMQGERKKKPLSSPKGSSGYYKRLGREKRKEESLS